MKTFTNILRWIIYVPLVFAAFYLISLGFIALIMLIEKLKWIWIIIFLITGIGLGAGLLHLLSAAISTAVMFVAPNRRVGGIIFGLIGIYWMISGLIGMWQESNGRIGIAILLSLFFLGLWIPLIAVGFQMNDDE